MSTPPKPRGRPKRQPDLAPVDVESSATKIIHTIGSGLFTLISRLFKLIGGACKVALCLCLIPLVLMLYLCGISTKGVAGAVFYDPERR